MKHWDFDDWVMVGLVATPILAFVVCVFLPFIVFCAREMWAWALA